MQTRLTCLEAPTIPIIKSISQVLSSVHTSILPAPISQGACDLIRLYAKPRLTNPHYYTHVIVWSPTPFLSAPTMPTIEPISNNMFYNGCCHLTEPQAAQNVRSPNTRTNPIIGSKAYILPPNRPLTHPGTAWLPHNTLYLPRHMVLGRG